MTILFEEDTPESERVKTEAKLFFSSTGKCSSCYLVFITLAIAVRGTSSLNKVALRALKVWASKDNKAQLTDYVFYISTQSVIEDLSILKYKLNNHC